MVFKREPALAIGVLQAVIGLLVAFGLQLSAQQVGAVSAVAAAALSFTTRRFVSPTPAQAPVAVAPGAGQAVAS